MKSVCRVPHCSTPDWPRIPEVRLTHTGWLEPCPITAKAQICHDGQTLWVRMEAEESPIRATLTGPLDPVCTDSCLEFFFAPDPEDKRYFNFEFNPLGNLCLGFGAERPTRMRIILKDAAALLAPTPFETGRGWGIEFRIPLSFIRLYFPDFSFSGVSHANFYKCGDSTPVPHYLAWAPLSTDTPDYHRRQDFGTLSFAP